MKGKRWLHALIVSIVAVFGALAIACGGDDDGKKDNKPFESPAIGVYYYEVGADEYLLSLNADKTLALTIGSAVISGKYDVNDSGAVTFTVTGADKLLNTAKYADDEVTLTYDGTVYKFLRRVDYTVTFNTGSGSKVDSVKVRNGKKVTKPADPEYAGHVFIGWYKDAESKTAFKFATDVVRGNLTLYAGWVEKTERDEYTVKFDLGYGDNSLYSTVTTVNGKVYAPEMTAPTRADYAFKGWWFKDAESGEYATRVDLGSYVFTQNETVYALWQGAAEGGKLDAPIVTVDLANNRLSWDSISGAANYSVKVIAPDGTEWKQTVSGTSVEYADKFTKAGTYTVEVYAVSLASADKNSAVTTRKIVNKQLARVSNFNVTGDVLTFSGVANATKYLLYIECGDENHDHNPVDNGSSKEFNFGDCAMSDDGIKFVVEAQADGYVSSRSEEYTVARKLDKATGFKYDENTQTVSWSAVQNATSYYVTVKCDNPAHVLETEVRNVTSINIGECTVGSVKVTVVAKNARKYIPSDDAEYTVNKTEWAAVTGLAINDTTLTWKKQSRVKKYIVDVNGVTCEVVGDNSVDLGKLANLKWEVGKVYDIKVRAELNNGELTSWSLPYSAAYKTMTELKYSEGVVSWTPVFGNGTAGYKVVVNDAAPVSVNTTEYKVTLTDKTNVIKVYLGGADISTAKSVSVNAYKLTLDVNGGTGEPVALYYAKGDPIAFPKGDTVARRGYNLTGWYTSADGNSAAYTEGDLYDLDNDLTLFARWDGKEYTIRLNYNIKGNNTDTVKTVTVKFDQDFTFELPDATKSALHGFLSWNTASAGDGEDVTDEFGKSTTKWHYTDNNMMVYVKWGEIFAFEKYGEGNDAYYVVRKGPATTQRTEIEVPETYMEDGDTRAYPVRVVGGNAFQGCFKITKLTLPSTIDTIEPTALTSLSYLEEMNIIGGKPGISRYWSEDGVVFGVNPLTERTQLEFFPRGRTGDYTMPEGIDDIPYEGFMGTKIDTLTIPYTVKRVAATAFMGGNGTNYSNIKEIIFAEPSNPNANVEPLNIVNGAFKSMLYLTDITFPSRTFRFVDMDGNESDEVDFKAGVFYGCSSLANINIAPNNADYLSIDGMLCKMDANGSDITVIFCPNAHEFVDNKYVTNNRITVIGTHAFSAAKNLRELEVGASVTKIEDGAFSGYSAELDKKDVYVGACQNLAKVTFKGGRGATKLVIGRAAFGNSSSFVSGSSVSLVCKTIENIIFEDGCNVTEIGNYAFAFSSIKTVKFPTSLKKIGYGAFKNCSLLENVTIAGDENGLELTNVFGTGDDNVTRSGLFEQCTSLTYVYIPKCVTKLSGNVFLGCKLLTTVDVDPENPALEFIDGVLYGKKDGKINSLYYILPGTDMSHYVLPDGITEINGGVFANVGDQLQEITLGKYVTHIGAEAFKETGIKKVIFLNKEDGETEGADELTMGSGVFKGCKSLTEVVLPKRLKVLPDYTFDSAGSLESVTLPAGIQEIGAYAFQKSGIKSITIPNTVEMIGYEAFNACSSLTTVKFDEGTTKLKVLDVNGESGIKVNGEFAKSASTFYSCTALTTITLPKRLENIGGYMFYNCYRLGSINIPASVEVIGINAFYGCTSLSEVKFADRATDGTDKLTVQNGEGTNQEHNSTTYGAFSGCTSLTKVVLPKGLDRIANYMFYGCSSLQSVYIPNTVNNTSNGSWDTKAVAAVQAVGSYAFNGCSALKKIEFEADDPIDLTDDGRTFSFHTYAFGAHPQLTEITLPARFGGWRSYTSATAYSEYNGFDRSIFKVNFQKVFIDEKSAKYKSDANGIIYSKDGAELIFCPAGKSGKVTIPGTVTKIKSGTNSGNTQLSTGAFSTCTGITEIEFAAGTSPLVIGENDGNTVGVFNGCTGLTSITLPERLTALNDYAFSVCTSLKEVKFDGTPTITRIGNRAFTGCTSLAGKNIGTAQNPEYSFVVPKSVTQIGNYAFYADAALTSVTFDGIVFDAQGKVTSDTAALTEIGVSAFEKTGLLSIYLPKTVTTMGNGVFANCAKLAKASLPNTVTNLNGTFTNCGKLTELNLYSTGASSNFVSENSIIFQTGANKKILSYYPMSLTSTILTATDLAGTTEIADNAFSGNRYLQEITIPNTVTKIGENAFKHCTSLKKVIFEADTSDTENIGLTITNGSTAKGLFYGCYNMETVAFPKRLTALGDYTLAYLPKLSEVTFPDDCKMTQFPQYAFRESGKDAQNGLIVNIPANITKFNGNVFQDSNFVGSERDAQGKAKLVIPASVTTFGTSQFLNAVNLTTVEFNTPNTKRANLALSSSMFSGCTSLSSVKLPNDLVKTGSSCFANCTSLTEVNLADTLTDIAGSTFSGCTNLEKVNSTVIGEVIIPNSVTLIDSSAFLNCGKLTKITLPSELLGIGNSAFAGMGITEITIPNKVGGTSRTLTSIGYMFTNNKAVGAADRIACESLTSVTFADDNARVKSTSANAFSNLPSLTTVKLPHGANVFATIGNNSFINSGITAIEIPKTVSKIEYNAFKGCSDLENVTFEKDEQGNCAMEWVGYDLFRDCTSLATIELPKKLKMQSAATTYSSGMFDGCTSLKTVVFESDGTTGITNFVKNATDNSKLFLNCTSLTTVRLPEKLSVPGVNLFQGCTSLENVIFPSTVTTIPNYTFDGCSSLKEVKFGDVNKYKPADFAAYTSTSAPTSIGNYAFRGAGLKTDEDGKKTARLSLIMPATITSVGTDAFVNSGLYSVTIMSNVTAIPANSFKGSKYLTTITIPTGVTTIGASAFEGCTGLTNVSIPASVTSIGDKAFYQSGLTSFNVVNTEENPSQLKTIGANAFSEGDLEGDVVIPASVTTIGDSAFYKTAITSVSFGKEDETSLLTTIGNYAFRQTSLESVVIPASVTSIGNNPFANCQSLTQIEVDADSKSFVGTDAKDMVYSKDGKALYIYATGKKPGNGDELEIVLDSKVTEVKPWAFSCGSITKLTVGDGVTIRSYAFQSNDLTEVTLGANVTLEDNAFRYNTSLTKVTIGEGAVIKNNAFDYCSALEALTIPAKSTVDTRAFSNCANFDLEKVTVSEDVKFELLEYTAKVSVDGTVTIILGDTANHQIVKNTALNNSAVTHIEIAEGITAINADAFYNFTNLVSVKLPSTLKTIGNNAFRSATKLESINFPAGVTTIGYYAFYQCPLTDMEVDLGDSLVSTDTYVFSQTGIKSVKFPKTFKTLGNYAFQGCTNLTTVLFAEDGEDVAMGEKSTLDKRFDNCPNIETFVFSSNQTIIPNYLFDGKAKIVDIVIPASVKSIQSYAFRGTGLTEVTIPATITTLGSGIFQNCTSLSKVTLGTDGVLGVVTIPDYAFQGTAITEITIPKNVTTISKNAFADCTNLSKITFEGLEEGDYALTKLNEGCFANTAVTEFVVPENVATIYFAKDVFMGDKLTKITLSPKTTYIQDLTKYTGLKTIIIPEGVTSLNKSLMGMTWIKELVLPSTLTTIGEDAFNGWTAEQEIHFAGLTAPAATFDKYWRRGCKAKIFWDGAADLDNPKDATGDTQTTANLLAA